jgi:hypothetical protein
MEPTKETKAFTFRIIKHIGVISNGTHGWKRELNVVAWNDGAPKYDIRDWNLTHEKMGKGILLKPEEVSNLLKLLVKLQQEQHQRDSQFDVNA